MSETLDERRVAAAMEYFRRIDAGDPSVIDLMTEDIQVYLPKFGVGYGKAAFNRAVEGLMGSLRSIEHDFERMNIIAAGENVVVEGFEKGVSADGTPWPVEGRSEGRYCNVFQFEGLKIKRVHIYVDPDFNSEHEGRFLWATVGMTRPGDI